MHAWEQIQLTVDYIEEHLSENMSINGLAKLANLSPFYYQRLFSRLVKKPVFEYIKLRRMANATEALRNKDERILDIALGLGFTSHEHFTRTFKDTFGITPEAYRKSPVALSRMTKPEIFLNYTVVDEGVPLISEGIVLEINRKRLDNSEFFQGLKVKAPVSLIPGLGIESGTDPLYTVWENFHDIKHTVLNLLPDGEEISVTYPCSEKGYFSYFAGAKSTSAIKSEGLECWELCPGEYIVCSFEAENFEHLVMDVLYKATGYLFNTWLPQHGLTTEPFSVERYESHDPSATKMELWVKPVVV